MLFHNQFHFLSYFIYFLMSSCTLLLVLVTVYYHRIAVLCFSYHVIYFSLSYTVLSYVFHILYLSYTFRVIATLFLIFVYLSFSFRFHVCKYLEADTGNNYMYPVGTITVRDSDLYLYIYPKVSSLYETVTTIGMTQTGPL